MTTKILFALSAILAMPFLIGIVDMWAYVILGRQISWVVWSDRLTVSIATWLTFGSWIVAIVPSIVKIPEKPPAGTNPPPTYDRPPPPPNPPAPTTQ